MLDFVNTLICMRIWTIWDVWTFGLRGCPEILVYDLGPEAHGPSSWEKGGRCGPHQLKPHRAWGRRSRRARWYGLHWLNPHMAQAHGRGDGMVSPPQGREPWVFPAASCGVGSVSWSLPARSPWGVHVFTQNNISGALFESISRSALVSTKLTVKMTWIKACLDPDVSARRIHCVLYNWSVSVCEQAEDGKKRTMSVYRGQWLRSVPSVNCWDRECSHPCTKRCSKALSRHSSLLLPMIYVHVSLRAKAFSWRDLRCCYFLWSIHCVSNLNVLESSVLCAVACDVPNLNPSPDELKRCRQVPWSVLRDPEVVLRMRWLRWTLLRTAWDWLLSVSDFGCTLSLIVQCNDIS